MANESFTKLRKLQLEAQAVWQGKEVELHEVERLSRGNRVVQFFVRVHRSFVENRGPVRAAALAYTTVLALVPLLAIAVSVLTTLLRKEGKEPIDRFISGFVHYVAPALDLAPKSPSPNERTNLPPATASENSPPALAGQNGENVPNSQKVVDEITGFIQRFRSGTLGASGVLALVFVAISLLSTIEATFNDMWGVREGRRWAMRVALYWTGLTLGPLFVISAVGLTSASQIQRTKAILEESRIIRPVFDAIQTMSFSFLLPCLVLAVSLALLYLLIPNAKVDWRAAAVGGGVAALLLQANSALSAVYLSRVVTYRDVYGTLAAIPLFLLGLYVSWIIVLWGGQVAFVFQTRRTYGEEKKALKVNQQSREFAAIRLMACIGQRFQEGGLPSTTADLAKDLSLPATLIHQILSILNQNKLLVEVAGKAIGYSPARPLDKITAQDILRALRVGHGDELSSREDAAGRLLWDHFESIQQAEKQIAGGVTVHELVSRVQKQS